MILIKVKFPRSNCLSIEKSFIIIIITAFPTIKPFEKRIKPFSLIIKFHNSIYYILYIVGFLEYCRIYKKKLVHIKNKIRIYFYLI